MNQIANFSSFAKSSQKNILSSGIKNAIVYTRVSGKEQADKNLSLETQKKAIEEFAGRNQMSIAGYFGGTYESAKTDGRKEFLRMLDFMKKNKGKISHILVYILDRFSRTGGGAIKLAEDLREKYGVDIIAVTQPADTSNPGGVLQQSIQFVFSKYDNELRKQRTIAGMKEKFNRGIWIVKPPIGYDIIRSEGQRKIVVNETGKKLRKAFVWKGEGMSNQEVIERLEAMGLKIYKQKLTKILKNPFYCGLIAHGMLNGKVIEGLHEKLISQELFLKVNEKSKTNSGYGVPHKTEHDEIPLKVFLKCGDCGSPFTGYVVKAKKLWYYKCRTNGCKCNKSAKELNKKFSDMLENFCIKTELIEPLKAQLSLIWKDLNKEKERDFKNYKAQLNELEKKLETIEEKYYLNNEMSKDVFEKFQNKLQQQRNEINQLIAKSGNGISNPEKAIEKALQLSTEIATVWASSDYSGKEKLQKLIFPEGIYYNRENASFRTTKMNTVFSLIASLSSNSGQKEKGQTSVDTNLSLLADWTGLEPATSAVTGRHSNQLNYQSVSRLGLQR